MNLETITKIEITTEYIIDEIARRCSSYVPKKEQSKFIQNNEKLIEAMAKICDQREQYKSTSDFLDDAIKTLTNKHYTNNRW